MTEKDRVDSMLQKVFVVKSDQKFPFHRNQKHIFAFACIEVHAEDSSSSLTRIEWLKSV